MNRILIIPDSFKNSAKSIEVCIAIEKGFREVLENNTEKFNVKDKFNEIVCMPMSDGGEGFLDTIEYNIKTKRYYIEVPTPDGTNSFQTYYLVDEFNNCAYIEAAKLVGVSVKNNITHNPLKNTSFPMGVVIRELLKYNYNKVYIGVGGTIVNDAGLGMAAAIGFQFQDDKNNNLLPIPENLSKIDGFRIDNSFFNIKPGLFTVVADVQNVLYGHYGATAIYGKQKGVNKDNYLILENGIKNFSTKVLSPIAGVEIGQLQSAGAGGGLAAALYSLCKAEIVEGAKFMMRHLKVHKIKQPNIVITGEGKLDTQTKYGKLVYAVAQEYKNKPNLVLVAVGGQVKGNKKKYKEWGFQKIISIVDDYKINTKEAIDNVEEILVKIAKDIAKEYILKEKNTTSVK